MGGSQDTSVNALWILARISCAVMRPQGNRSFVWRFLAFIVGFAGTLLSWLVVRENSGQAYGIQL